MNRIIYVNGRYVDAADAVIPVMDRGFLFADGIYEVSAVLEGRLVDNSAHLARLDRSLAEIGIANPFDEAGWTALQHEMIRRNALREGVVYIQVTRGVAERDFVPSADLAPTVVMFTQAKQIRHARLATTGARVITVPDIRWPRRDIKSIALLAQVMAKRAAAAAGVAEAWMIEDGLITEGASSTAFIIKGDRIVTRARSTVTLPGVTRLSVLELARRERLALEERGFSVDEALAADEAFFTGASNFVMPVVAIDDKPVADGTPGPLTRKLRDLYIEMALAD